MVNKFSKQLDYLVTSLMLMCVGLLFLFLNRRLNSYPILHFSLLQICQSVLLLILAALSIYGEVARGRPAQATEESEQESDRGRETVDSVNATMVLVVVAVLVVGFYMFTARLSGQGAGMPAPIHMVVCVVSFILYACVEKWWSLKLRQVQDASGICNLMIINKAAVLLLFLDMAAAFTGLFSVARYIDWAVIGLWGYVALSAGASVAIKVLRHGRDVEFHLYVPLPFYRQWGAGHSGALEWLEKNTGISMRSLWSLRFLRTTFPTCALGVVLVLWLSTCVVQVEAYQQGALYRFGRLSQEDILGPGLHWKLPIPFEVAKLYDVGHARSMVVGYEHDTESKNNLWTVGHQGEEYALLLGAGRDLVAINLKVMYRISDLHAYLTNYASPESALNAKGYEIVMHKTVSTDVDTILSVDRSALAHQIEDQLKEYALWADLGIEVMGVSLASIHPPIDIADIYQSVVSAGNQKRAAILTAEGGAMAAREQAQADKQVSINQAGITRDERVSAASAEIIEYNAEIEAYELDREVYRLDRYLDTVERALAGRKKYLIGGDVDVNSLYSGAFSRLPGVLLEQKQAQADGAGEGEAG